MASRAIAAPSSDAVWPGEDETGRRFASVDELWASGESPWYQRGAQYWQGVEASLDGVLGGFAQIDPADVTDSRRFLREVRQKLNGAPATRTGVALAASSSSPSAAALPSTNTAAACSASSSDSSSHHSDSQATSASSSSSSSSSASTVSSAASAQLTRAADCGAGIGRVTAGLLVHEFACVDLIEQNESYVRAAKQQLSHTLAPTLATRLGDFVCVGLQEWMPPAQHYDCIWVQWVIGHLTEAHFIAFVQRCLTALKPASGVLIIKDNVVRGKLFLFDRTDWSVTRTHAHVMHLLSAAGASVLHTSQAQGFPAEIFPVQMYAVVPARKMNVCA